jgi:D-alanyl-D-alanine carboxypeptidase (penicillin-binding protein 5/6)
MMRARLIWLILTGYAALAVLAGVWTLQTWSVSAPVARAAVLGASTETQDAVPDSKAPALGERPTFTAPAGFRLAAGQAVLYDQESGMVLYSQSVHQAPIASTTKMMTALIATRELSDLSVETTVSAHAAAQVPSRMGLYAGEKVSIQSLLYGMLMVSGNDAANAVGEYVGGKLLGNPDAPTDAKLTRFVQEMNDTAAKLHMADTKYADPAGLDDHGHSSALDLAKLAGPFTAQPAIAAIISKATAQVTDSDNQLFPMVNSDRLVQDSAYFPGILGGKTGYTPHTAEDAGAGHCLVATAHRNGHTITVVILDTDSDDNEASQIEARKGLEAAFAYTTWE